MSSHNNDTPAPVYKDAVPVDGLGEQLRLWVAKALLKVADISFTNAKKALPDGSVVELETTTHKEDRAFTTRIEKNGHVSEVNADFSDDEKIIDVKGVDRVEHYVRNPALFDKIEKAAKAIQSGNVTKEEAASLKIAHEMLLNSMVDQPDGSAQLDESKLPNIMKAYDAAIKEGQRGL